MKKIINEIERLGGLEYNRAIARHGSFYDRHHGLALLEEEVVETGVNYNTMIDCFENLKTSVFNDYSTETMTVCVDDLWKEAEYCAAEIIQVLAMCLKFKELLSNEK